MPPALVVVAFGRGRWLLPLPLPVILLWPLALPAIIHCLLVRNSRAIHILRVVAATKGFRLNVRGSAGERFLIRVI